MIFAVVLYTCILIFQICDGFVIVNNHKRSTTLLSKIPDRKAYFFELVESGLKDRFPNRNDVQKVFQFCQFAKQEQSLPPIKEFFHEPCEEYVEGLRAYPWWNTSEFVWIHELEIKSKEIKLELENVIQQEENLFKGDSRYMSTMGSGWTAFRLQRLGEWNNENMQKFPTTTKILQNLNIPLAVRGIMFAKQLPKTGVKAHSDGRNFILTCHLGLSIPNDCTITVGGEKRLWLQDKAIVFDTSFVHETENNSSEDRYVLIIDFWHPDLTLSERLGLEYIYDTRNKFESNRIDEIDCSYLRNPKNPKTIEEYIKSKRSFGNSFANFFNF